MSPRVLVVDDDWEIRWLVTFVLQRDPNVALVGEAPDGEVAVSLVRQGRPAAAVLDVMIPRLDRLGATPRRGPGVRPQTPPPPSGPPAYPRPAPAQPPPHPP